MESVIQLQEESDPQLGELIMQQQSQDNGVKDRGKAHEQDPGLGFWRVQVLEDEVIWLEIDYILLQITITINSDYNLFNNLNKNK